MRRKLAAIVAGAMIVGSVSAEDIKMSPVFDVSYLHSDAESPTNTGNDNQGQYINGKDDMDVQYAGIDFSGSSKSVSWMISANFAGDGDNTQFIDQATLSYAVNDNLSVTAGRFYSFVGYEAARNNGEWNYTKSIAKTISPYWHEGVSAAWDAKNGFNATAYFVDGVANSEDSESVGDQTSKKGVGASLSYAMDMWKAEFDYYTAANRTNGANAGDDTIMAASFKYDFNDKFSAALTYQMGTQENSSTDEWEYKAYAAYIRFQATEKLYFAGRYEMFSEENTGGSLGFAENATYFGTAPAVVANEHDIDSITLTAGHNFMNGSELKLEYRMDSADEKIYTHSDGTADDGNNTVALAWLYSY